MPSNGMHRILLALLALALLTGIVAYSAQDRTDDPKEDVAATALRPLFPRRE